MISAPLKLGSRQAWVVIKVRSPAQWQHTEAYDVDADGDAEESRDRPHGTEGHGIHPQYSGNLASWFPSHKPEPLAVILRDPELFVSRLEVQGPAHQFGKRLSWLLRIVQLEGSRNHRAKAIHGLHLQLFFEPCSPIDWSAVVDEPDLLGLGEPEPQSQDCIARSRPIFTEDPAIVDFLLCEIP